MIDSKFIEAYWLFRTRKINSLREMGKYLGRSEYYHKGIYAKSKKYEESEEYKKDLKEYQKTNENLRGTISDKECFIEDTRGRKRKKGISPKFLKAYWDYENYFITPIEAYTQSGYSKNWFHTIAKSYEKTKDFEKELLVQEEKFNISKKPCRTLIIPDGFEGDVNKKLNINISKLADKYQIPEIQVKRLILKLDKKNIWKCIKEYSKI